MANWKPGDTDLREKLVSWVAGIKSERWPDQVGTVAASERLYAFLDRRFSSAATLREWRVHAIEELRVIFGRIDLLLDYGGDFVVIDHKNFPGLMDMYGERLKAFGGQVDL